MDDTHLRPLPRWLYFLQHRWTVPILIALMTLSLLLHALTLFSLIRVRSIAREQVQALEMQVQDARNASFSTTIHINRSVPINASVPIQKQLQVPISTTVVLNQNLPVNTPLGTINLPLDTSLPIRLSIPVAISETIAVNTSVDLDMDVPINVPLAGTSLGTYIDSLVQNLQKLEQQL